VAAPKLNYINSNIVRGMNFANISESIAEVNFQNSCRQGIINNYACEGCQLTEEPSNESEFYTDELYSFPSSNHIVSIFMADFDTKKAIYQNEMKKVTGCAISCDHTFRVSKNIGMVRPGNNNKLVEQFKNLFIILNEDRKVVDWQLTKTTAFKESSSGTKHVFKEPIKSSSLFASIIAAKFDVSTSLFFAICL